MDRDFSQFRRPTTQPRPSTTTNLHTKANTCRVRAMARGIPLSRVHSIPRHHNKSQQSGGHTPNTNLTKTWTPTDTHSTLGSTNPPGPPNQTGTNTQPNNAPPPYCTIFFVCAEGVRQPELGVSGSGDTEQHQHHHCSSISNANEAQHTQAAHRHRSHHHASHRARRRHRGNNTKQHREGGACAV